MDARLDTFSTELYQVNVRVGYIARRQATMGGFSSEASPPPPLVVSDSVGEDDDDDGVDDVLLMMMVEMLALPIRCLLNTLPFVTRDKKGGVVLGNESSHSLGEN